MILMSQVILFLKIMRVSSYYTHLPQTCILHLEDTRVHTHKKRMLRVILFLVLRVILFYVYAYSVRGWRTHVCTHVKKRI